jgi:hypothetical protein
MALDMEKFKVINFPLRIASVARLDSLAEKGGLSRAQLLTNLVVAGIEFLETCEGWGVFAIRKVFNDMKAAFSKKTKYKIA